MNRLGPILIVLGFFWNAASASVQVYSIPSTNGDYIQQTITIDNQKKLVIVHIHEGTCSSDAILDYKTGYIAVRIFSKLACFVMKMEKEYLPDIEEIGRLIYDLLMMSQMLSEKTMWVKYKPANSFLGEIKEWLIFGHPIEQLCRDIPIYEAERIENGKHATGCLKAGLFHIFNISICGTIHI